MSENNDAINLGVEDIFNALQVIDHAAEQGAFKGWENIRKVMFVRDRLESFVKAAEDLAKARQTDAGTPPATQA